MEAGILPWDAGPTLEPFYRGPAFPDVAAALHRQQELRALQERRERDRQGQRQSQREGGAAEVRVGLGEARGPAP